MQYETRWQGLVSSFFRWRIGTSYLHKMALVFITACLTGLCAQIRFYTPWSPVPITMQVFTVLLSGVVLGKWLGGLSQTTYLVLGAIGVPWFAPKAGMGAFSNGGVGVLLGSTGGYLVGFLVAAFVIGYLVDLYSCSRRLILQIGMMLLGVGIIYLFGWVHLFLWMRTCGIDATPIDALMLGVLPFIVLDALKAILVSGLSIAVLPKSLYGDEKQRDIIP